MDDLLTAQQAADIMGISRAGVHQLIYHNRFPATKHGRDWLIRKSDLDEYLKRRRDPGRPPKEKLCPRCNTEKPLEAFRPNKKLIWGRDSWCRACFNAYKREKRASEYKEQISAYNRAYYYAHLEYSHERSRRWRNEHKEYRRQRYKVWCQTPNGRAAQIKGRSKRAALIKSGPNDLTAAQIAALRQRQKRCAYCKRAFSEQLKPTIDHVIPLSKGGPHTLSNIVLACKACNSGKRNKVLHLL